MRRRTVLTAAAMVALFAANFSRAETAQQQKMKTCNADATAKGLKGADRKAFMKTCLSAGAKPLPRSR